MCQCMYVQNHMYANKSGHTYVHNIHELSNPDIYLTNVPFLYPLKMPENLCISGAFSGGTRTKHWPYNG